MASAAEFGRFHSILGLFSGASQTRQKLVHPASF
jgi:hypothetical protein